MREASTEPCGSASPSTPVSSHTNYSLLPEAWLWLALLDLCPGHRVDFIQLGGCVSHQFPSLLPPRMMASVTTRSILDISVCVWGGCCLQACEVCIVLDYAYAQGLHLGIVAQISEIAKKSNTQTLSALPLYMMLDSVIFSIILSEFVFFSLIP